MVTDTNLVTITDTELASVASNARQSMRDAHISQCQSSEQLASCLIEQLCRRVLAVFPNAHTLAIGLEQRAHLNADGSVNRFCTCNPVLLTASTVHDSEHTTLGQLGPIDPGHYILEQLSPLMPHLPANLRLHDRVWIVGRPQPRGRRLA